MEELIIAPVVRYGFLGLSAVLLVIIVWLIRKLLQALEANQQIVAENTSAIDNMTRTTGELMKLTRSVHQKLLARPCIASRED
ncbi:MAG: hypothetical protein GXY74_15530 [Phycisphaerae bacterium]|nr:hypothetical protein [Phycisphaerae bacterium]